MLVDMKLMDLKNSCLGVVDFINKNNIIYCLVLKQIIKIIK